MVDLHIVLEKYKDELMVSIEELYISTPHRENAHVSQTFEL